MRFVHIADMHFDIPFTVLSKQEELGDLRRLEQRKIFNKIIDHIKQEKIKYLFISGDLYEEQYIRNTTIEYINNLFKTIPETKIFIAPGNHDPILKNSYYNNSNWSHNVYIFNSEIKIYEFDDVDIYGFGFNDFYCADSKIEEIKIKNKNKINILIAHADLNASKISDKPYNPVNENKLKQIGFDYIALGHIHKQIINENIIYPGSPIAFGFDEIGDHGMLDVELEKNKLEINFIKLDKTEFVEKNIEISEINTEEELIEKINDENLEENKLYKIILIGNKNLEINKNKILKILNKKNIIKIKDETKLEINLEKLNEENNLKGYFIREILNIKNENNYSDEEINKAIEIGLELLKN